MLISLFNAVFRRGKSVLRRNWRPLGDGKRTVDYDIADSDSQHYPLLRAPVKGTPIVMPHQGKSCKNGPAEKWLAFQLVRHKIEGFYDNLVLPTSGHRYEPDLAFIDEQRGIYIDIENDEPYSMGRKRLTHLIGNDDERNAHITAAGWIVLLFSELQCASSPLGVARTVMEIAQSIDPTIEMPKALVDVAPVDTDARWNQDMAKKFAASNYRDTYLERFLPMYKIYNRIYK